MSFPMLIALARLAREAQKKILRLILSEGSPEKANAYLQELIDKVKARQVDVDDLAIRVRLTRNPKPPSQSPAC